jgi:hypothetical protein
MKSRLLVPALLLVLAASCGRSAPAPEAEIVESWSVMTMNGKRIGHTHSTRTHRRASGEIETFIQSRMALKRMGSATEINSDIRHVETPDGKPLRFSSLMEMSATPTRREGIIENGKLKLTTVSGGNTTVKEMDWDPEWLLSEGMRLLMVKKGLQAGTRYTVKTFNADYGAADEMEVSIQGREKKAVLGKTLELIRIQVKTSLQKGVVSTAWVDEKGTEMSTEMSMMGIKIVMEPATREEALREASADIPEIFFQTMPRSNVALPRPRQITAVTVRLERPDAVLAEWKPPAGTQSVLGREGNAVTLRVESKAPVTSEASPPDKETYLKASPGVQCDDAQIIAAAREIAGPGKDPAQVASRLASWVHDHIDKKSMSIAAASAKEVFTNKSGDCSEHAVLLAALLRATGIPAKVCAGYLYYRGAWGGHAWTSAWLGRWVDFDATLGGSVADAARIKFSETDAEDAGALMEGMRGAGFMHGGMKIEIQEFTLDGRTFKVEKPAVPAGDRFEAPLLGIAFEKPEGWTFRDPKDLPPFTLAVLSSPGGNASATVTYIDLPYEAIPMDTKKAARKLGAPSSGEIGKLGEFETFGDEDRLMVRISPGEMIEIKGKPDGEDARPALERFRTTLKITR